MFTKLNLEFCASARNSWGRFDLKTQEMENCKRQTNKQITIGFHSYNFLNKFGKSYKVQGDRP